MHANLMRAARVQRAFDECAGVERVEHAVVGARGAATFADEDGHFFSMNRMSPDCAFDPAALLAEISRGNREIDFRDFPPGELPRERAVRDIVFRGDETAARLLVESVDDAGPLFAADAGKAFAVVKERVDERAVPVAGGGMHDETGGFVEHDEIAVFKEHVERDVLGFGGRGSGWRLGDGDVVADAQLCAGLDLAAIHQDVAGLHEILNARAGEKRDAGGEELVNPRARFECGNVKFGGDHAR